MAEIKYFFKEREKRTNNKEDYKEKIRKHKMANVYRIAVIVGILLVMIGIVAFQYKHHIYTAYDVLLSVDRQKAPDAADIRLDDTILTYSKDGAHCTNTKGGVNWNQTYEIPDLLLAKSGNTVAIGNYNGRNIYIQNTEKVLGEIVTTMPIKNIAVSGQGTVTAVLEDTDVTWLNTYDSNGELIYFGQTRMNESGYPCAISLSPNGELLAVSYLLMEAGKLSTNIAFYNFGPVGVNQSDYMMSAYTYEDMLVPDIHFMDNETAFAIGDSRIMFYKGAQKPESFAERMLEKEIFSVYYSEKYVGLVFVNDNGENYYKLEIYNTSGTKITEVEFDLDYRNIFFENDQVIIYNETECIIQTMDGVRKYEGEFHKPVNLMLPANGRFKYLLVTDNSIDTIQLK